MGRVKWNKLSPEKKKEISKEIVTYMDKVTNMKEKFDQEFDFFDAINDEINSLFECNMKCITCELEDVKTCLYNFRIANVYMLKKLKLYENSMSMFMEGIMSWCQTFNKWLQADSDIELEIAKTEIKESVGYFS
jgi:hypothetical protein